MRKIRLLAGIALAFALTACGQAVDDGGAVPNSGADDASIAPRQPDHFDHATRPFRHFDSPDEVREAFSEGTVTFEAEQPFRQVGFMFDAPPGITLEWRGPDEETWKPVEITWNEADAYVARLVLENPLQRIELRASQPLESLYVEFYEEVMAPVDDGSPPEFRDPHSAPSDSHPATNDQRPKTKDQIRTTRQREAPRSLVIPREEWGARDPKCLGSKHDPYRMTIHHTASPDDDGGDPARRMRQMQNYHMDSNGWCDIGYHFVVSQSGKVFQGRPTEKRTGAHVGGHNSGNIGISLIGNFEEQTVNSGQFGATVDIAHWVHETYNIALDRQHVKGHTEWSGQGTSCPGDNMLNRLGELVRKIKNHGSSSASWDVAVDTKFQGVTNPYKQGTSKDRPDAFPGDTINAEIYVTNKSSDPIREVWLGYQFAGDHLTPTSYTIYDDHPAHDKKSWDVNDADSAEENPAKSKLGKSGKLYLYAFSPNETKRIHVELRADTYSAGTNAKPFVRGWIRSIKNVYGTKDSWGADPSTDKVGKQLRAASHVDILSRDKWHFNSEESQKNLEGWTGRGSHESLALSHNTNSMAMKVTGGDARLVSPEWTRIDADTYDQLVIRFRSHDGTHPLAIYWRGEGEEFADARSRRFELPGDGEFHAYRLPLGGHEKWSGTVTRLRIHPLHRGSPAGDAKKWYDTDGLYFRSTSDGSTSSEATFDDASTLEPLGNSDDDSDDGGSMGGSDDDSSTGNAPGGNGSGSGSGNDSNDDLVSRANTEHVQVNEGCRVAGTDPSPASLAWLFLVAFAGFVRIRV